MPSSQTSSYRKLLRRAQGAVRTLRTAGHSTMALEVELKRSEQAIARKHWAEAKEHLDTVLSSTPAVRPSGRAAPVAEAEAEPATAAPRSFSDGDRQAVADKLALARDRLAILDQFGIATGDLLTSLQRADKLLDRGYTAQAEALGDELLVMTKAAAEGLEAATHHTGVIARAHGGNGSTPHHDFLTALRGHLADLVKTQGWLGETEVRRLVAEAMGPLARAGEVEARLRQLATRIDDTATALRQDRSLDQEALDARLRDLRDQLAAGTAAGLAELRQALDEAAATEQEAAEQRGRLEQSLARLEQALELQREAGSSADAALHGQLDQVVTSLRSGLDEAVEGMDRRCAAIEQGAGERQEHLRTLAEDLATMQARLDALAGHERQERARLDAAIAGIDQQVQTLPGSIASVQARAEQAVHEHAQILIALESRLDEAHKESLPLRSGLMDLARHVDQELDMLRSGLAGRAGAADLERIADDLRQRLTALEQRLGDDENRVDASGTELEDRLDRLAGDLTAVQAAGAGLVDLRQELAVVRDGLAALRDTAADRAALDAATVSVQDQDRRLAALDQDLGSRIDTLAIDAARKLAALDNSMSAARQEIQTRLGDLDAHARRLRDEADAQRRQDEIATRQRLDEAIAVLRGDLETLGAAKADTRRIDELAARLDAALTDLRREDTERIAVLGERIAQVDARADLVPAEELARTIAAVRAEIATIAATKADRDAAVPPDRLDAVQEALTTRLAELETRAGQAASAAELADIRAALAATTGGLREALAAKPDAARIDALAARLDAALTDLRREDTERIAILGERIAQVDARADLVPAEELARTIAAVRAEIATIAAAKADRDAAVPPARVDALHQDITDRLAALDQRLAAAAARDELTALRQDLQQLSTDKAESAQVEHLAQAIADLGTRTDHAASATDLAGLRERLDAATSGWDRALAAKADAAGFEELARRLDAALGDLKREDTERIAALGERIAQVDARADLVPAEELARTVAGLRAEIAALAGSKADGTRLDAFARRLDAACDEAQAVRDEVAAPLARLATLREDLTAKLDAIDQRLDGTADSTGLADLRRDLDRLAAAKAGAQDVEQVQQELAALRQQLADQAAQATPAANSADLDSLRSGLATALAAKADNARLDVMAEKLAQLLADMRQELDARLAAQPAHQPDGEWQEHFAALATDLRATIEQTIAGKVDTAWLDQVEAGLDRRLVLQEETILRIETALARRKTVDESTEQDATLARLMGLEQEVAALGRDLLAKGRALDELRAAGAGPAPDSLPADRLAAIEAALAERATLAQAEAAAQQAAAMVPELMARIDSVALDLADLHQHAHGADGAPNQMDGLKRELEGLRGLAEHVAQAEHRVEERLAACEAGLATAGAGSNLTQLPDRIRELITNSEDFRALVSREVAVARNFVNPRGEETEQVHRTVADLAQRVDHMQERAAPVFAAELAMLRQKVEELEARAPAGAAAPVDIKQLRDQVVESLRPLIPRSEKVVEVINAAVHAAVSRLQAPAPAPAAPDPKALRKLLPDLLTAPEIRSTIISTVLLEALSNKGSLGNLTGIRQLVHDELLHIIAEHKSHLSGTRPPVAQPPGMNSGHRPTTGH